MVVYSFLLCRHFYNQLTLMSGLLSTFLPVVILVTFQGSLSNVEWVRELYVNLTMIIMLCTLLFCHLYFIFDFLCLKDIYIFAQHIERPYTLIEEDSQLRRHSPVARVEKMFELLYEKLPREPKLILCVLPERKTCDIYGVSLNKMFHSFTSIL